MPRAAGPLVLAVVVLVKASLSKGAAVLATAVPGLEYPHGRVLEAESVDVGSKGQSWRASSERVSKRVAGMVI